MASENRQALNNPDAENRAPSPAIDSAANLTRDAMHNTAHDAEDEYLKRETVRAMLSHVIDPEVGLDILTMGLIYDVDVSQPGAIRVEMTLTTKGCPMSAYLTGAAKQAVRQVYPGDDIQIRIVWDPPWTPAMINRDGLDLLRR